MPKHKIFCVIGKEFTQRQHILAKITRSLLGKRESSLHVNVFYPHETELEDVRRAVSSYSFSGDKILVIKDPHLLDKTIKQFLLDKLEVVTSSNYLVFDIEHDYQSLLKDKKVSQDAFIQCILKKAQVYKIQSYSRDVPLFALLNALRRNDRSRALYVLEELFREESNETKIGMQILGMLIREFSKPQYQARRSEYLDLLWEADRSVKERGLKPKLALSILLTKIFSVSCLR